MQIKSISLVFIFAAFVLEAMAEEQDLVKSLTLAVEMKTTLLIGEKFAKLHIVLENTSDKDLSFLVGSFPTSPIRLKLKSTLRGIEHLYPPQGWRGHKNIPKLVTLVAGGKINYDEQFDLSEYVWDLTEDEPFYFEVDYVTYKKIKVGFDWTSITAKSPIWRYKPKE